MPPPLLAVKAVSKTYGATPALCGLSLEVQRGELFGLMGPSGCGKTTTLRVILGLETPDHGTVEFEGRDLTAVRPEGRGFGMVFQNYALFSKWNVYENVVFGLEGRAGTEAERRERVETLLAMVRLPYCESRRVDGLSAGEQQRVAIARALACEPPLLLLDEPLAHLDIGLRRRTGSEIRAIIKRLNLAAIYVTHDQWEALGFCDRVAVMSNGRILQAGTPTELYEKPREAPVAQFLGFNMVEARRVRANVFEAAGGVWRLQVLTPLECDRCLVAMRPEDISAGTKERGIGNAARAVIRETIPAGPITRLMLDVGGFELETVTLRGADLPRTGECVVEIPSNRLIAFPAA